MLLAEITHSCFHLSATFSHLPFSAMAILFQETEDAVKSIFDGDDEEEEPQYPTLVFVPGKNGAVVASAALSSGAENSLASTSVAATNEETNRATSAITDVEGESKDTSNGPGDVSDVGFVSTRAESCVYLPVSFRSSCC